MGMENFFIMEYDEVPKHELVAYTISKIAPIEQLITSPSIITDNGSTPMVSWRYNNISEEIMNELKACVENFKGNLEWILFKYTINYTIEPKFFNELRKKINNKVEYVKTVREKHSEIFYKAIDDIPKLSEAIEEWFDLKNKKPQMPIR